MSPAELRLSPRSTHVRQIVPRCITRRAERGDRPVDDGRALHPPNGMESEPRADLETLGGRPFGLRGHRQIRVGRRRRLRVLDGRRLCRPIPEESGLVLGIGAAGREDACRSDDGDQPLHRSHAAILRSDVLSGPRNIVAPWRPVER